MRPFARKFWKGLLIAIVVLVVVHLGLLFIRPSNDRDWAVDQAILPEISMAPDKVTIKHIRNFIYSTANDYTPDYYDGEFRFDELKQVYFIVEPFMGYFGAAHTFLSFEFTGNRFLAISVEIRKEKGESYSIWKGMARQYELMYVIADERDLIKLRSNFRKDEVYVYPAVASQGAMIRVFKSMLERAHKLQVDPEFYHTLFKNCTTSIASHVREIAPDLVGWDLSFVLPANSDRYAYDLGLLDRTLPFEETREKHHINERARRFAEDPEFSLRIRER